MSSTVGYGVEITKDNQDYWEGEQLAATLGLVITTSRHEYGTEERVFLLDENSIVTAGKERNTASALVFSTPVDTEEKINKFFEEMEGIRAISPLSWWLVDYYLYS